MKNWGITVGLPKPDNAEEIVANADFNSMRVAIMTGARDSVLISQVMRQADYMGLSGEDRYTALAYQALIQLEHHAQRELHMASLMPNAAPIMRPASDGLEKHEG